MSRSARILTGLGRHVRHNVIGYLALFIGFPGAAYAAHEAIYSSDIVNGQVQSIDVADNNLTGGDIATDSITGTDVLESTLSVRAMGCQSGKVLGFARVKGATSGFPATYTSGSSYIDIAQNCAGPAPQARRVSTGVFHVKFPSNTAALALVTNNADGYSPNSINNDNILTVHKIYSSSVPEDVGAFRVEVEDVCDCSGGSDPQNAQFTIVLP